MCRSFLSGSRKNGNLVSLLEQFLIRHGEVLTAIECQDPIFPWHVGNALYIIRRLFLHLIQHFDEGTIFEIFAQSNRSEILKEVVRAVVDVLYDVSTIPEENFLAVYGFVVEAQCLLLRDMTTFFIYFGLKISNELFSDPQMFFFLRLKTRTN